MKILPPTSLEDAPLSLSHSQVHSPPHRVHPAPPHTMTSDSAGNSSAPRRLAPPFHRRRSQTGSWTGSDPRRAWRRSSGRIRGSAAAPTHATRSAKKQTVCVCVCGVCVCVCARLLAYSKMLEHEVCDKFRQVCDIQTKC